MPKQSGPRAGVNLLLAQVAVAGASFPISAILARTLGPDHFGDFQWLNRLAILTISVVHLGYPHAVAWASGRQYADLPDLVRKDILAVALRVSAGGGLAGGVIVCVAGFVHHSGVPESTLAVFVPYIGLNLVAVNIVNFYRGSLATQKIAIIRISQAAAWLILVVVAASRSTITTSSAIVYLTLGQAVGAAVGLLFARRDGILSLRCDDHVLGRQMRTFALKAYPGLALRDWNIYLDQIVVGAFLSSSALASYSIAASLTLAIGLLNVPVAQTTQPLIQRTPAASQLTVAAKLLSVTLVVTTAAALPLAVLSPWLVPLVYGGRYAGAVLLVQILCLAMIFETVNSCSYGILVGLGRPGASSRSVVIGSVLNVVGWAVMLPTIGVTGAALTSVLSYAGVTAVNIYQLSNALTPGAGPGVRFGTFLVILAREVKTTPGWLLTKTFAVIRGAQSRLLASMSARRALR